MAAVASAVAGSGPDSKAVAIKVAPVDYPPKSLRAGEQGRVEYIFTVTARGKVKNCVVTKSTGFMRLDKATCELVGKTTYAPARTGGLPVAEDKTGVMNWRVSAPPVK
nr:energy transducer TonB [Polymorphobacter sp.]